jgi:uncharacterized membrane protein
MSGASSPRRIPALDMARGIALLAMILYHTGWDLSALGLAGASLRENPVWQVFGNLIAASFLLLAGVSLVLAHGGGVNRAAFLRRLAQVAGAAALITGVTWYLFPQQFIFFGILHAIALGSVLALPFLRAPLALVLLAAGLMFVLPAMVKSEVLSSPWLVWLGLALHVPPSQDFVPVFPWFGFLLLGVVLARVVEMTRWAAPPPERQPAKLANLAGRHSLAVYLLHQPLIYGTLWLMAQATSPPVDTEMRDFLASCARECTSNGGVPRVCTPICACAAETLKHEKLWSDVMSGRITPALQERFGGISHACALR